MLRFLKVSIGADAVIVLVPKHNAHSFRRVFFQGTPPDLVHCLGPCFDVGLGAVGAQWTVSGNGKETPHRHPRTVSSTVWSSRWIHRAPATLLNRREFY